MTIKLNIFTILTIASFGMGTVNADPTPCLDKAHKLEGLAEDLRVQADQAGNGTEAKYIHKDIIKPLRKVMENNDEDKCNTFYETWCQRYTQSYTEVLNETTICP